MLSRGQQVGDLVGLDRVVERADLEAELCAISIICAISSAR